MSPSTISSLSPDHHGDKYSIGNGLSHHHHHLKKKRVGKACDSCRLKKTKCSGKQPCEKCQADNKICVYTERKKSKDKVYSYEYVELIEQRFFLVKKSLIRLCELIKSGDEGSVQLADFANRLNYDPDYEEGGSPISINQAVSLLLDRADSVDMADDDTDINFNTTDEIPVATSSSNLANFDTLSSSSKAAEFHNGPKTSNSSKKPSFSRVREKRPALSTDYHVVLSSPESLTSKSDEQLSPLQNAATNESSIDSFVTSERQPNAMSSISSTHSMPSLSMSKSSTLTGIKEENDSDDLLSPTSPLLSGVSSNKPDQFDLGPFQSGAQLAAAIMNGFQTGDRLQQQKQDQNNFSNTSSNTGFFSMSDFDLNSYNNSGTGTGSGTPASMMGSSPVTESLKLHYTGSPTMQPSNVKSSSLTTMNSSNNGSFSPLSSFHDKLIQPGDSFTDFFNAVEPPSNLNHHQHNNHHNRSDSIENKKHTHHGSVHHGSGHARSYSPHPHPYRTSAISSSSTIGVGQQYPTTATTVGGGGDSMASNVVFENEDKDDFAFLFKSY